MLADNPEHPARCSVHAAVIEKAPLVGRGESVSAIMSWMSDSRTTSMGLLGGGIAAFGANPDPSPIRRALACPLIHSELSHLAKTASIPCGTRIHCESKCLRDHHANR